MREAADLNEISLDEAKINAKKAYSLLEGIKLALEQLTDKNKLNRFRGYISLFNNMGDLASQHWAYLPTTCREILKDYYEDRFNKPNKNKKQVKNLSLKQKFEFIALLGIGMLILNRNILVELKNALEYFGTSMQQVLNNEKENQLDWELACAARKSIQEEGTTSWEDIKLKLGIKFDTDGTTHQEI